MSIQNFLIKSIEIDNRVRYNDDATHLNNIAILGAFLFGKNVSSFLHLYGVERCVAAFGALHFSVRSFGCALFIYRRKNMGLFKDIYCSNCGEKTNLLTRLKLKDGQYLCSKCSSTIPSVMKETVKTDYGIKEYQDLLKYIEYSNKALRPVFRETHSYYNIHIDTEHGLLYFGYSLNEKTVFFELANLAEFNLVFDAEKLKEGMLGDKVQGKLLLVVKMTDPYFYHEEILDYSAKAKAKRKLLSSRVEYENPHGMDEFILYFETAWQSSLDRGLL